MWGPKFPESLFLIVLNELWEIILSEQKVCRFLLLLIYLHLYLGDVVEFNVSTDRRDNLQRAVNIKLISVCLKNGQTREVGVVSSLKEGFGFIKCADQDLSIFFHFSEVLEQVRFRYFNARVM